jgi:hypothetical protein
MFYIFLSEVLLIYFLYITLYIPPLSKQVGDNAKHFVIVTCRFVYLLL